jgi:hypothetical protein
MGYYSNYKLTITGDKQTCDDLVLLQDDLFPSPGYEDMPLSEVFEQTEQIK